MNYLAHILISKNNIDYQLGNLLADPLKGKTWDGCPSLLKGGFQMHSHIDGFTDSNKHVQKSKKRLGKKGYLRGVVVDVTFDYLLLKNWEQYVVIDSKTFINRFYDQALKRSAHFPDKARVLIERMAAYDILSSYATMDGLAITFKRIDKRLSDKMLAKESTFSYLPVLESVITKMEVDFGRFFPQLIDHFKEKSGLSKDEYWLK